DRRSARHHAAPRRRRPGRAVAGGPGPRVRPRGARGDEGPARLPARRARAGPVTGVAVGVLGLRPHRGPVPGREEGADRPGPPAAGLLADRARETAPLPPHRTRETAPVPPHRTRETAPVPPHRTRETAPVPPHRTRATAVSQCPHRPPAALLHKVVAV